jgi:hypothetical protein
VAVPNLLESRLRTLGQQSRRDNHTQIDSNLFDVFAKEQDGTQEAFALIAVHVAKIKNRLHAPIEIVNLLRDASSMETNIHKRIVDIDSDRIHGKFPHLYKPQLYSAL